MNCLCEKIKCEHFYIEDRQNRCNLLRPRHKNSQKPLKYGRYVLGWGTKNYDLITNFLKFNPPAWRNDIFWRKCPNIEKLRIRFELENL